MGFTQAEAEMADAYAAQQRGRQLLNSGDYSGVIEAAQHCIEHAIKSAYKLVDLDPPRTHEAVLDKRGKDTFVYVVRRLRFPNEQQFLRLSWIGPMWSWGNNTAVYGYEEIPAATFFWREDAELAMKYADNVMSCVPTVISLCKSGNIKIAKSNSQHS